MSLSVLVYLIFCHVFLISHIYKMVLVDWICIYTNTYQYLVSIVPHTYYFSWSGSQILSPLSLSNIHHLLLGTRIFKNKFVHHNGWNSTPPKFDDNLSRWFFDCHVPWQGHPENRDPFTSNRSHYQIITKDSSPYAWSQ